ncbi:hypothetical protein [Micromonospora radicis]|uniref:Uncharacterized protein n=1 Tax=Micromonospora radicis TaxID=1894971 RepID=A0A418MQI2_9ACTN|nr:hypothetical protein [Micromonospora radicis]RIV36049.1 hypothetical protein D2L64_20650 [Micromonospora radicis]
MTSPTKASTAPVLPAVPASPPNDTPEVLSGHTGVLAAGRWADRFPRSSALAVPPTPALSVAAAPPPEQPSSPPPEQPPPPPAREVLPEPARPRWVDADPWGADDRARLRRVLTERYDAYARVVIRTLAEEPGLRAAGGAHLVGDLVALCAYGAERDAVNQVLRGADGGSELHRLIARGAVSGLRRLPTVIGPVYATSSARSAAGYRAGDELVEPAFVDVGFNCGVGPAVEVEYVIWSVSARRVDQFTAAVRPAATFPPGSRFAVLAVDEPADDRPLRVLLRDRTGERRSGGGTWREETLRRLRRHESAVVEGPSCLDFALGLDPHGHPFTARTPASSGGS